MSGPLQDRLRHVELKVIDNQHCADMYGMKYNIQVDRDMHLCAGPILSGGKGTCIVSKNLQISFFRVFNPRLKSP